VKVFVINLDKDIARRAFMSEQLGRIHVEYEVVPGVYGAQLSQAELKRDYCDSKARRTQGRSLMPAEIGITLSHIAVYRRMIAQDVSAALILEDDTIVDSNLPTFLAALASDPILKKPSVVLFSPAIGDERHARLLVAPYCVAPYRAGFFSNAYVVSQTGARALLHAQYPAGDVADCWKRLKKHRVVDIYVVTPALCIQDQNRFGSSTTEALRPWVTNRTSLSKIQFKFKRGFWWFADGIVAWYRRSLYPYGGTWKKGT